MPNKLSHSQIQKWEFCEKSWSLHYQDRIRPVAIPSPLAFGNAIGKTFEHILQAHDNDSVDIKIAKDFFDKSWTNFEWNNVIVNLKKSKDVVYLKSDFDEELGATPWESLRVKGHLMIDAFIDRFLPLVTNVYSTEEQVELFSGDDSNIGFADAVVDMIGYDTPIVLDFKTAGRKYEENSVRESVQLGQYLYTLGDKYNTKLAGYVVFLKQIRKNRQKICKECGYDGSGARFKTCNNQRAINAETFFRCNGEWTETIHPECDIQIIIDEIPLEFQEQVIDNIGVVNDNINSGQIVANYGHCEDDGYGKPCIYFGLCHNNSMAGLIKLEDRKIDIDKIQK